MSPYMNDCSPLSSVDSLPTPPGAWVDGYFPEAPAPTAKAASVSNLDSVKNGVPAPSPTGSVQSVASTGSKKRSHPEVEDPKIEMPQVKRQKKATPKAIPRATPKTAPKATAPPVGTRSSGRTRKAPERFTQTTPPKKVKAAPARKPGSKVFDPTYITTNANSRLKKTDVFHMLLQPSAWTCLLPEEKLQILDLLSKNCINVKLANDIRAGTAADNARPREFNINFNLFRTDVAKFKEDLENGHFGKTWQVSAEQAIIGRAEGKYDDWKEQMSELWWGQN
ncbi:hypothetical protein BU23DRAFT_574063 [Bimuria novae-zelandiae CBS 107.79]|uniref:ASX DEUBAD domain-containing protein n=1 Tax=Bimuria novae-zelandiae CBS 107.79 TaxID=1447943 RepID=A0A6A5UZF8_9PLEO|nr:hypothetical protein BU23DRAFT_574063 [Bimuria novae-zelandiae CBS 107.79]